jgi:hypothetical protein
MNKLKEAENGETAIEIMKLALSLDEIHDTYKMIPFVEQINIAIEILKLYETRAIRINLIEIDDAIKYIGDLLDTKYSAK